MSIKIVDDVVSQFAPVRDQGRRPTCAAFAVSDLHASARSKVWAPLSAEYIFYHACLRCPRFDPNSGVTLNGILEAAEKDGQPEECEWPYIQRLPRDLGSYKPPSVTSAIYRKVGERLGSSVDKIATEIASGQAVMVVFTSTLEFVKAQRGTPVEYLAGDPVLRPHAVIAVTVGDQNGQRCVKVRNSWGNGWADHGYAWLSEGYLNARLIALVRMVREWAE